MAAIGIISVHEKKASALDRLMSRVKIKEAFGSCPEYIVAEVSCSASDILKMSRKRREKLLCKARKFLFSSGATAALPSAECRAVGLCDTEYARSFKIPPSRIFECFMFCRKKMGDIDLFKELHIFDKELTAFDYEKLSALCTSVRQLVLHTDKTAEADRLAQRLFAEYGIFVKISSRPADADRIFYSIIDADCGIVRIGDFRIDGAEFISNSGIYNLDAAQEAAILGDSVNFEVRNWLSGKNVIKTS